MTPIYVRFPGFKRKAVTLSYDDGVRQDKPKVAQRRGVRPSRIAPTPARPSASAVDESRLSDTERRIYSALREEGAVSPDTLVVDGLSISAVLTALTKLELMGLIVRHPNGSYSLPTD